MCDDNDLLNDNNYGPADDDLADVEAICTNCGEVLTECTCEEVCPNCGEALADCSCEAIVMKMKRFTNGIL